MKQEEIDQIVNIIMNFEGQKAYIPYFSDLAQHPTFGPIFKNLADDQKKEVENIIVAYIQQKIETLTKTKWAQLFKRFFEAFNELFWKFRALNEPAKNAGGAEFQKVGKQVEQEIYKLEGILTEKMFKQEKGLDKVVSSFYTIVYTYFPKYGDIE